MINMINNKRKQSAGNPVPCAHLVLGLMLVAAALAPAALGDEVGQPQTGEKGITVSVAEMMRLDRQMPPTEPGVRVKPIIRSPSWRADRPQAPDALPAPPQWLSQEGGIAGAPESPQTPSTSFLAVQIAESGFIPPDSVGGVSPTQVLVHVNGRIKVFDRNGVLGGLNAGDLTFWNAVRNGQGTTDPQVRYDRTSDRWFVTSLNTPAGANRVMIAVSNSGTITSTSSFTFFFINASAFADYDSLGVDANALYIGANVGTSSGATAWVVRKSSITSGGPIVFTTFSGLITGGDGPYSPRGVDNDDPTATQGYIAGISFGFFSRIVLRRISNPGTVPSISSNIIVSLPTTVFPIFSVPALGSTFGLDAIDDRLFAATIHKNHLTGAITMWTAHNIEVNSSGIAVTGGGRNGSRWYQIQNLAIAPSVLQSGTLFDPAGANPKYYWFPSACMSGQGHAALGCSYAGTLDRAGIAVAGRLSGDAPNTTQGPTFAIISGSNYNVETGGTQRWGDYSATVVDPADDQTIWTFQEYCNSTNSWGVRVIKLLAPPPATPASCAPSTVNQGQSGVSVIVSGTSVAGSGFFDPEASFTKHIGASVSGTGVTVNSVTFTDPTHVTLNLTVDAGAAPGARFITVTNPDGQGMVSTTSILTIQSACAGDIEPNNAVDVNDLLSVITHWGPCPPPCPPSCIADVVANCQVDVDDLLAVITHWGPCP